MRCKSLGTRISRATGIIGVTQDLVDGRICILANTQLLAYVHTIWANCSSRAGPRRSVAETWSLGQGGQIVATAYTRFSAQFLELKNPTRLSINRIRSQMPDSVSENTGEICLTYDDVRHWLTGSAGKSLRNKWHWHGQCGAVCYI